jgi:hypothetical protein
MTEIEPAAMTADDARELVGLINAQLADLWDNVTRLYAGRGWLALGYGSWDEMCRAEFDTSHLRIPRSERAETVASLREAGLSVRAIAAATGDSVGTVHAATQVFKTEHVEVQGVDGKTYPAARTAEPVGPTDPLDHIETYNILADFLRRAYTPQRISELPPVVKRHLRRELVKIIDRLDRATS